MRPKLVSMTFGMTLVVRDEQGDHQIGFSGRCPSPAHPSIQAALDALIQNINEEFGTHYFLDSGDYKDKVIIARPKRVDSVSNVDHLKYIEQLQGG